MPRGSDQPGAKDMLGDQAIAAVKLQEDAAGG